MRPGTPSWPWQVAVWTAALIIAVLPVAACGGDTTGSQRRSTLQERMSGAADSPTGGAETDFVGAPEADRPTESGRSDPEAPGASGRPEPGTAFDPSRRSLLVPDPALVDLGPARWESAVPEPDPRGRRIAVRFTVGGPPCHMLGGVDVDGAPEAVTITLLTGADPGVDCSRPTTRSKLPAETVVVLREPLGERRVLDGAAG